MTLWNGPGVTPKPHKTSHASGGSDVLTPGDIGATPQTQFDTHLADYVRNAGYAADAGSSDSYEITLNPAPTAYVLGMVINFEANTANTGACTLNINTLGAKEIKKNVSEDLATNDIKAGQIVTVVYDGTNFQFASAVGSTSGSQVWLTVAAFTRVSDSAFTVSDDATNQDIFKKGRPIRYRATAGTWRYGIVTNYSVGTVTLAGAPLTISDDDEMSYTDFSRVVQTEVMIPSSFAAAGASSTLINTVLKSNLLWRLGTAYLVRFGHIVDIDDSGVAQTRVNVNIANAAVGTANTNAGPAIAETWTYTTTDINTANYDVNQDEEIEITCDANGTNDDARDLTISLTFVLA